MNNHFSILALRCGFLGTMTGSLHCCSAGVRDCIPAEPGRGRYASRYARSSWKNGLPCGSPSPWRGSRRLLAACGRSQEVVVHGYAKSHQCSDCVRGDALQSLDCWQLHQISMHLLPSSVALLAREHQPYVRSHPEDGACDAGPLACAVAGGAPAAANAASVRASQHIEREPRHEIPAQICIRPSP